MQSDEYRRAQLALAELKAAVFSLLERQNVSMSNAAIGRSLGIYGGHKGHEGHISRTTLAARAGRRRGTGTQGSYLAIREHMSES